MPPAPDAPLTLAPPAAVPAAEAVLDALPWGVLALDAHGVIGRANPAAAHWCGTSPAALLGRPLAGVPLPPAVRAILLGLLGPGPAGAPEAFLPHLGQWLTFSASPLAGGGWLLHGHDSTERRQREQNLAFLAALNVDFAPQLSAKQLMAHVSEQLAAHLCLSRCHLAEVDAAASQLEVVFDWRREANQPALLGSHRVADYLTAAGQQHMAAGQPLVLTGLTPNPLISTPLTVLADMGFGSSVDIPLLIDGQWCFLLTAARAAPGEWRPDEVALLQQLASRLHARLARAQADTALQVAHDQLADVLEHTHDAFYGLDKELRFTYVNRRAAQLWGRERASLLGHVYWQLFPQAMGSEVFHRHQEVLRTRQPAHFETLSTVLNAWIEVSIYPNRLGGISVFFRDISARRHVEERRDFLLQLSDALRPATDPIVIQEVVTRLARRHFGADRCYYCELEDGQAIIRRDASAEGLPPLTGTYRLADFALLQALVVAGQPFWVRDVRQDAQVDDNLRQLCVQLQIISYLNVPVVKGGHTVGVLCLVQTTPRAWAAADVALATEVADRTWAAVTHARSEAALQASEQRLRAVMENLPGGAVFVVDAHLRYQLAEGMVLRQLGLQAADFVGRPVQELAPPPLWPDYEHHYRQALAGRPFAYEHTQDERTFATRGGPLRLANGTVAALAVSYDITASKQTEAALKESEEKYRTLFNSIDEGYCIIELLYDAQGQPTDWRFVEVNPAFEKNNGLVHATGKTIRELTPDIEPKWIATYAQVAHSGEPRRFEEDSLALGRWFSLYAFPVGAPGGPLVAVLFTDITARKQAEDSLRLGEVRLSLALRAGRMGSFEWTAVDSRITLSAISQQVLGLPPDAEIATSEAFFALVHPDDRARHQATFAQAGRTGTDFHSTYRIVRPLDGEVRWLEERGLGTHEPGVGVCLRGVHWDVTESVQVQQQLAEFNGRLEQRVARRTHELRASRDLLQSVFDTNLIAMSVMEAVRAADGTILDFRLKLVSRELVRTTGRTDLVGKLYSEEYPGIREAGLFDMAVRTVATGEPQGLEYYYNHEGFDRWFACQFVKLGDGVVATNLDITERKTAEQERLKNLRLLEQAEAVAGLGSWDYDLATGTMRWSAGMYQLFGLPLGSPVAPAHYLSRVVPDDRTRARRLLKRLATGAGDLEETLRLRMGTQVKTLRLKAVVLRDEAGQPLRMLGVDLDISELQRLEQDNLHLRLRQQQGLFEAVQAAQEAERKRIAESLHNGLGQILYATKLHLDRLHAPLLGIAPALAASRLEADQLLREAIRQTRALSHELVPLVLADFGLPAALQDVCRKMSTPQLRLRCHMQLDEAAAPLGPALQMAIYRMAQELTQNIIRHARGATAASLELETMPGWVLLRVEDNGPGFAPAPAASAGLGLRSIRDRVALLGGQMETGTAAVGGAYVRIRIPLFTSSTSP